MERELSSAEREAFFRKHFQVDASGLVTEKRKVSGGFVQVARPHDLEYRAAHLALPPAHRARRRTMAEILARIDELEAGATWLKP